MHSNENLAMILATASLLLGAACEPAGVIRQDAVSERGGFADAALRLADDDEGDYCAAELLRWRYDEASESLRIADARVLLGCCGQRAALVERVDGLIELTEIDAPDPSGRCGGACAYDVAVTVPGVKPGHVVLKLLRDVTDAQGGPELVWQGTLDLARGSGSTVLPGHPDRHGCREAGRPTGVVDQAWILQDPAMDH
ncbi:MAG TPA: hypothetical protein VLS89_17770 [Candidatus Nanopelagicales bacterium]|nr:hypothetical protein [Candidatus Nanopelagicales bacterium]